MAKTIEHVHWPDAPDMWMPYAPAIKVRGGTTVYLAGVTAAPVYHHHPHRRGFQRTACTSLCVAGGGWAHSEQSQHTACTGDRSGHSCRHGRSCSRCRKSIRRGRRAQPDRLSGRQGVRVRLRSFPCCARRGRRPSSPAAAASDETGSRHRSWRWRFWVPQQPRSSCRASTAPGPVKTAETVGFGAASVTMSVGPSSLTSATAPGV